MAELGKYNKLKINRTVDFGAYLNAGDETEILMPGKYLPENSKEGDEIEAFVYRDSEDRLVATTEKPSAQVGEFAFLPVKEVTRVGAFLDWGLAKDLLVPFREQRKPMEEGGSYIVYVYVDDETGRITASARLEKFLDNVPPEYEPNQEVDLLIGDRTDLGYKVIINNLHSGIIYHNEIFRPVRKGEKTKGYIKQVRDDDKIDVSLQLLGYVQIEPLVQQILDELHKNNNFLPLSDRSSSEEISARFGCSKKSFKKAIGALYRQHFITMDPDGIRAATEE